MSHHQDGEQPFTVTRRTVLKGAAVTGAAVALSGGGAAVASKTVIRGLADTGKPIAAVAGDEKVISTYCPPNCGGRCRLMATVRDGRLVKVEPGEFPDPRYTAICVRGLTWPQRVYSPSRLKFPMKRVGERGEGKFERISWDEALNTIATRIKESRDKNGPGSVAIDYARLNALVGGNSYDAYWKANGRSTGIDLSIGIGQMAVFGPVPGGFYSADLSVNEWTDRPNARLQIIVGNNPAHTSMTSFRFLLDAQASGTKLVVIDPWHSATTIHADMWVRPHHGTDTALFLGMLNVLIERGLVDTAAALQYSSGPLLVRLDTKKYLREADIKPGGSDKKFVVWDLATESASVDGDAAQPALEGAYRVDGISTKTAYQLLKERAAEYPPEKVEQITGVPAAELNELAVMYGTLKPSTLGLGYGIDQSFHGGAASRLAAILAVLTDNWGKPGASVGIHSHGIGYWGATLGSGGEVPLPAEAKAKPDPKTAIKVAVITRDPMNNRYTDLNAFKEYVKGMDFVVNVEQYWGTTSLWSDIILPACTFFESPTELVAVEANRNSLLLESKAIEPMWESKPDWQIEKELAERLGFGQYFEHTPDQTIPSRVETSKDPAMEGITMAKLREAGALRLNVPEKSRISKESYRTKPFPTATGRAEIYSEALLPIGEELPIFKDDFEASPNHPLAKKYPLVFNTHHAVQRAHSTYYDSAWLLEIWPEPILEINPVDAEARGLKTGDYAEAFNDRGHAVAKVVVNPDSPPGLCNIQHGWKQQQYRAGHHQELTNPKPNPADVIIGGTANIAFQDSRCEVRKVEV